MKAILNHGNFDAFRRWLTASGWRIEQTFEPSKILQARRAGRKYPLMLWDYNGKIKTTPRDEPVIRAFLKERIQNAVNQR